MGLSTNKSDAFMKPELFSQFTYSRKSHCDLFREYNYEVELFKQTLAPSVWPLKRFQDLLVFAFIKQMVPGGSRLLDVGGGNSRIIRHLKDSYECWNVDKLEGCGKGPTELKADGFRLVKDYMGNFNPELPDDYFDLVFSVSALEHVPDKGPQLLADILKDLNRVLKPGGYSLHCFDSIVKSSRLWTNKLLLYFFDNEKTFNRFIPFEELRGAPDMFALPESIYNERWLPLTKQPYQQFGKPFSYNVLWKKNTTVRRASRVMKPMTNGREES